MSGFHSASEYSKWTFVLLLICGLFVLISYFFPFWATVDGKAAGLWWACKGTSCYERWNQWNETWVHAVQVCMTVAVVMWAGAVYCIVCYIFVHYFHEDKRMVFLCVICSYIVAFFTFLSLIIWSASQHYGNGEVLNWAYVSGWIACILAAIVGTLMVFELRAPIEKHMPYFQSNL